MRALRRDHDGNIRAIVEDGEASIIATLARHVTTILETPDPEDPALTRLLPVAYTDDSDAAAEFRRLTTESLTDRKTTNARILTDTLRRASADGEVILGPDEALAWLKSLTDIRLILAARLGITEDDQRVEGSSIQDVYDWLGFLQNSLLDVVDP